MAAIFRASALGLLGRLDPADDALRALEGTLTADWFGRGEWLAVRAQVALWSGRPAVAAELVSQAVAVPTPLVGGHILPMLTGAWAALERGIPFEAASSPIRSLAGASSEFEGLRALVENRPAVAAERFGEAAALWQDFNAVRALSCGWGEGEALRRAGSAAAIERLTMALEGAEAVGFEPVAGRIRRSLRLSGIRVAARPGRRPTLSRLTPRESELLDLVGRGQTNDEIARRMGLGRPTVVRILSNAMLKLGASSRAQAVALAAGPTDGTGAARPASDELGSLIALLARGMTLGQAATELGLSRRTADRRLAEARLALGARRTTEAVVLARQAGWFE
jgi:DNA-binding NarL/FixJ family response regulator